MFAAASVLGAVVRWMREQSGTGDSASRRDGRVVGFCRHPAAPPAKA
jgi:hypothetical protein